MNEASTNKASTNEASQIREDVSHANARAVTEPGTSCCGGGSATNEASQIREDVSRAYARAVTEPGTSCCGGGSAIPKGVVVKVAGYTSDQLSGLPADAVVNSFGCGNPLAFSDVREGDVVLDLGSGAGIDLLIAARKVGPTGRVIGVDMTDEMIARARTNLAAVGATNAEVRKGLIEALPVETGTVDWVISNCVINLSPDKPKVFAEIARVLKPGGRMRVSDIVAQDLPEDVRGSRGLYCSCIAGAISEDQYLQGLRQAGLEEVSVLGRIEYSREQVEAFVKSELPAEPRVTTCCGGTAAPLDVAKIIDGLQGRIWSVRVAATKASR